MGIVNVTPDSFSDGGRFLDMDAAIDQGFRLREQGADIVDIAVSPAGRAQRRSRLKRSWRA
jgi:dihydropteroate synthase